MTYYKYTDKDGLTYGSFQWSLPTEDGPGEWVEVDGELVSCRNGLHVLRVEHLSRWLASDRTHLWEVAVEGEVIDHENKLVARRARLVKLVGTLDERRHRLLACDFAERVLPIWEMKYPNDNRPRHAIETARRYANKTATREELVAARDAAWAASWAAAKDAARDAASVARVAGAAWDAAWAAKDAARDAAWDAARDAAWAAWAAKDAARAAKDAARDAAGAAGAAWAAAWAAAWDAGDAERLAQGELVLAYARQEVPS